MVGTLIGTAAAAAAAAAAIAGHILGTNPAAVTMSPFGGSVPAHIAHIGRIDVDLGSSSVSRLHRVRCASGQATLTCFVAR
jgi:hypothetical protein